MQNLAGRKDCDSWILRELKLAGITPIRLNERCRGEVSSLYEGRLGKFTFDRAWYYWRVHGPMPLEIAEKLDKTLCPPPSKPWALYYEQANYESRRYATLYGARMALKNTNIKGVGIIRSLRDAEYKKTLAHDVIRVAGYAGGDEPKEWARNGYIDSYHVDTIEGLKLLADTIKAIS